MLQIIQEYDAQRRREEIAKRIRTARQQFGITQIEAAKLLGCSRIKLNRVERGKVDVSAVELDRLALTLRLPVSFFYTPSNEDTVLLSESATPAY